jgi:hypothetical protein
MWPPGSSTSPPASHRRESRRRPGDHGFTCRTVTASPVTAALNHTLPVSLSPVTAHTPEGTRISRSDSRRPGTAIVWSSPAPNRFDTGANHLLGIGLYDSAETVAYDCTSMVRDGCAVSQRTRVVTFLRGTHHSGRGRPRGRGQLRKDSSSASIRQHRVPR